MLVTALSPVIGYDKASKIAHHAMDNDLTLKEAALQLGFVTEAEFDRVVDPKKMVKPYVASDASTKRPRWASSCPGLDLARAVRPTSPIRLPLSNSRIARSSHDIGGAFEPCARLRPGSLCQRPSHRADRVRGRQLGRMLGLRAKVMPRWGELQLQS